MMAAILSVHTGKVAPLGPDGEPSGFVKQRRDGAVAVGALGLDGDAQADLSVHGGPEKAVYAYAADHPQHAALFAPGVMGENLAIAGMTEADVCVGDIHRIGSVLLQACQPRQPCFKLGLRFDDAMMVKAMVKATEILKVMVKVVLNFLMKKKNVFVKKSSKQLSMRQVVLKQVNFPWVLND